MIVKHIQQLLKERSKQHAAELKRLGKEVEDEPLSPHVSLLNHTPQFIGVSTILQDLESSHEDFVFYFDRLATLMVERAMNNAKFSSAQIESPYGHSYQGLLPKGEVG